MKKFLYINIIALTIFLISCQSELVQYSSDPLTWPEQHQFIYKADKVDAVYWSLVETKGNLNDDAINNLLSNTPDIWKNEIIDTAKLLYQKRMGD